MKILVDMNLSPIWVVAFAEVGIEAVHRSEVGDPRAADSALMDWARRNNHIVFTHDLDFGTALALTQLSGPSVIQVRTHDVTPNHLLQTIVGIIEQNKSTSDRCRTTVSLCVAFPSKMADHSSPELLVLSS